MAQDGEDIFWAAAGFFSGIFFFFKGFSYFHKKRLIDNIPTSTIRGLAMGLVELVGKVKKETPFRGPFTNQECVLYKYTVERLRQSDKHSEWAIIAKGDSFFCPIWVEDTTGKIMVSAIGAELIWDVNYEFSNSRGKPFPQQLLDYMENNGINYRGLFSSARLRFREWHIKPGQEVYCLGTAQKVDSQISDAESLNFKLIQRLEKLKEDPVFMSEADSNKDGKISNDEWDIAVRKVEQSLLENEMKSASNSKVQDVIISRGLAEKTFIISDKSQKELTSWMRAKILLYIFGGACLSLVTLGYLLFRFRVF
ncbi:MAG: hypothetical protein ABIG46_03400 [Candidatus Omnitrophota bacterium]|nr:hypothetical protein [Candidatus Omnitrophota bacterium]